MHFSITPRARTVTSGILLRAIGLEAEIGVFLTVGVSEEVEATYLVGTIRLAETRADAAIINLQVQTFAVMNRRGYRADRLAGGVLAVHAGHRLKPELRIHFRTVVVNVDPQPMHVPAAGDFLRPDHCDIVLCLAGDHAGVAADAHGGIDHHRPGVSVIRLGPLRQQARVLPLSAGCGFGNVGEIVQRVELPDVFRGADHVLGGEDFLLPARLRDRHIGNAPGMRRGAQGKGVDTDAVADRAGFAAAEPEREAHAPSAMPGSTMTGASICRPFEDRVTMSPD